MNIELIIYRDLFLFWNLVLFLNFYSVVKLGCNVEFIVDEFGEKFFEEFDYIFVSFFIFLIYFDFLVYDCEYKFLC